MILKVVSEKNKTISEKQKKQEKGDLASILKEKRPLFLDAQQIILIESIVEIMKASHAELRNNADRSREPLPTFPYPSNYSILTLIKSNNLI